tara:strand:- start:1610 stop:1960 length:351 start_codon:yes stop_codon:yes gene_type:complete
VENAKLVCPPEEALPLHLLRTHRQGKKIHQQSKQSLKDIYVIYVKYPDIGWRIVHYLCLVHQVIQNYLIVSPLMGIYVSYVIRQDIGWRIAQNTKNAQITTVIETTTTSLIVSLWN